MIFRSLFNHSQPRQRNFKNISPDQLNQQLQRGEPLVLLDVRSPEEYSADGHIPGSRLLPLPVLRQRSDELPKDRSIVIICRTGRRSQIACEQLAELGFTDLSNVVGGIVLWRQTNLAVQ